MADRPYISVAALQPELRWRQFMPNLHHLRQRVEALTATNAVDLLVLPESFTGVPAEDGDEPAADQAVQFLSTLARVCRVAVVGGSVSHVADDGAVYNTTYVMNRAGELVGSYHKRRLFGREQETRTPGTNAGIFDVDGLRVGVLICADLWHAELARELIDRVDVLCVPTATVVVSEDNRAYARSTWHQLAMIRALETGLAIVVSDWADGRHESTRTVDGITTNEVRWTAGASSITDPSRRPDLARMQKSTVRGEPDHLVATIDSARLADFRAYRRRRGLLPDAGS